jgi:hypothetical protein
MEQTALASAQQNRMALSVSIPNLILGDISLKYEYSILPFLTLTVPVNFQSTDLLLLPPETPGYFRNFGDGLFPNLAATAGIGARFHCLGWYIEPILTFGYVRIDYALPTGPQHLMLVKPTLLVGYYTIFTSGLYLNIGIGVAEGLFYPTNKTASIIRPDGILALGYVW